jgi:hypothetical protein
MLAAELQSGCEDNPLYCASNADCKDPAMPYCDLVGQYGDGIGHSCVADPDAIDGGKPPDQDASLEPDAGSIPDADPTLDADPTPDAMSPPPCPDDYEPLGELGGVYRLSFGTASWSLAEADCEDDGLGTHLVVLDDEAELARVVSLLGISDAWIGVTDRVTEGSWMTVLGDEATLLPWAVAEPDDANGGEDCAEMLAPEGTFKDSACGLLRYYVCECDGVEPDPSSF